MLETDGPYGGYNCSARFGVSKKGNFTREYLNFISIQKKVKNNNAKPKKNAKKISYLGITAITREWRTQSSNKTDFSPSTTGQLIRPTLTRPSITG
jgi:hypothetical protein